MSEVVNKEVLEESVASENIVKISDEVIMTIAGATLTEIEGVHSTSGNIASGIVEFLGVKKAGTKGIKVLSNDNETVSVEIHIAIKYGYKIPDVAWEIQEKVKAEIESITGLNVERVNVHVDSINIEKSAPEADEEAEKEEE